MATYRVYFSGWMDVIADNDDEAMDQYYDNDCIQAETTVKNVERIDDENVFCIN